MPQLPVFLQLRGRPCLVIGGGAAAARKTELLLRAGAAVSVVAATLNPELTALAAAGRVRHLAVPFAAALLDRQTLVIAASGEPELDRRVAVQARRRRIPVNVVDTPAWCTFTIPAIVDRSPLLVAIGSDGAAPVLVRRLRERIESLLPADLGEAVALAGRLRERVKTRLPGHHARRRFWEALFDGLWLERVLSGRQTAAAAVFEQSLTTAATARALAAGEIYLVDAGPNDPDLLTFRGLRLMQQAEVVLYDASVAAPILALARRDAERRRLDRPQEMRDAMITLARAGRRVCRLLSDDPAAGESELRALRAAGIDEVQLVPGVRRTGVPYASASASDTAA